MADEGKSVDSGIPASAEDQSASTIPNAPPRASAQLFVGLAALIALYLTSRSNYLLSHTLAEMFSVVIATGIFMIAWNSRRLTGGGYFLLLGIAYLFIGAMDMVHAMAYKDMSIFPNADMNLPTQLWIAARYMESLSLFAAALIVGKTVRSRIAFPAYALVFSLLLGAIFYTHLFPDCFIEGAGLTPFKKTSEYSISLILAATIFALLRKRDEFDDGVFKLLIASIILTIFAELAFTFYISAYGFSNFVGHFFKIVSFCLIYNAIIVTGVAKPYDLLFRNLKRNEEAILKSENRYRKLSENLEDTVREKVAELRQAESLAAMGRMVSTVAHEVRNPLHNIRLGVDTMQKKVEGDEDKIEILKEINYGVDTLNDIIKELLDYSRPVMPQYSSLALKDLVNRALKEVAHAMNNVDIRVDLEESEKEVSVDVVKMTEVLVNLMSNAAEAMPGGGNLIIAFRFESDGGPETLRLSLTDTGCGISKESLERIHEPFFTTKTNGTGLGIPTCKKIIEAHGGRIDVTSEIGEGTTVEISLPMKDTAQSSSS